MEEQTHEETEEKKTANPSALFPRCGTKVPPSHYTLHILYRNMLYPRKHTQHSTRTYVRYRIYIT